MFRSCVLFLFVCCGSASPRNSAHQALTEVPDTDTSGLTTESRFKLPEGYFRTDTALGSFPEWLRALPLKPHDSKVRYFDGTVKENRGVYCAVVDMEIGNRDLQQCADAVMRLRAEYLYAGKRYDEIGFIFTGDRKWHGYTGYVGNDRSRAGFRKYMDHVFAYANTASLHAQLKPKPISDIRPGDVFIQKGNPYGHAVIVMDVCRDTSGNIRFMLAQSYMPAQDIQVLLNPAGDGPWFDMPEAGEEIRTPEWTFLTSDLRTW